MSKTGNRHCQFSGNRSRQYHGSRQLISPGNRLTPFCDKIFLYRDTDNFRDSCVAMCQLILETMRNNDLSREIGK